jgi:SAM-dependent methyltransferase
MYLKGAIGLIKRIIDDTKDWRIIEMAKYDLAWNEGISDGFFRLPFLDEVNKLGAKKILDVGCGDGTAVNLLNWFGYDAYGIDISGYAARRWNGVADRCKLAFAHEIPCEDNEFDLASADILEHVPIDHVSETIKEIGRVSKNQMFYLDYKPANYLIRDSVLPHITVRPPQWWRKEFRRCGLEIMKTPGHRTFITRRK